MSQWTGIMCLTGQRRRKVCFRNLHGYSLYLLQSFIKKCEIITNNDNVHDRVTVRLDREVAEIK